MNLVYKEIFITICHVIGCFLIWHLAHRDNSKDYTFQLWFKDFLLIILIMVLVGI